MLVDETVHLDQRKTRSLSFAKEKKESLELSKGDIKRKGSIQLHDSSLTSSSLSHLKRAFSITSSLFRVNSNIIEEKGEDAEQADSLELFSQDMQVDFRGDIWSVSDFAQISNMRKLFSPKKHEFGSWGRKTKICLEIGSRYLREKSIETEKTIALIHVKDMKFALTKLGKRYQFTIQGFNHLRELVTRVYEVNTSAELNIWYTQLSEAKSKEYSPRVGQEDDLVLCHGTDEDSQILSQMETSAIIPNHGYRFWTEFHAYVQKCRQDVQGIIQSTTSSMEIYEIKEDLAELEFQIKNL